MTAFYGVMDSKNNQANLTAQTVCWVGTGTTWVARTRFNILVHGKKGSENCHSLHTFDPKILIHFEWSLNCDTLNAYFPQNHTDLTDKLVFRVSRFEIDLLKVRLSSKQKVRLSSKQKLRLSSKQKVRVIKTKWDNYSLRGAFTF